MKSKVLGGLWPRPRFPCPWRVEISGGVGKVSSTAAESSEGSALSMAAPKKPPVINKPTRFEGFNISRKMQPALH